ncbi:hypothetical protein [Burkholderia thailandensis]|uniref:hypothetical protein n=1 Tax=Burkholderia thailandensis TaxID=57975 RepID=UPI0013922391|nr:hypothetical protein [Burkholderia thailandensis]MCS6501198.1 hypothetical protein [Burkholderia thailandensis]MCS6504702.1 hypothetical protein [Burkholderia thailandensis]MCS6518802.1 hypothetical protein [Burkholderia thailandensis]
MDSTIAGTVRAAYFHFVRTDALHRSRIGGLTIGYIRAEAAGWAARRLRRGGNTSAAASAANEAEGKSPRTGQWHGPAAGASLRRIDERLADRPARMRGRTSEPTGEIGRERGAGRRKASRRSDRATRMPIRRACATQRLLRAGRAARSGTRTTAPHAMSAGEAPARDGARNQAGSASTVAGPATGVSTTRKCTGTYL